MTHLSATSIAFILSSVVIFFSPAAQAAPVNLGIGGSVQIDFSFETPFTDTPDVLRAGIRITDSGLENYYSTVSLYDGNSLLSGPRQWVAQFPYLGGAVASAAGVDFSSIRNQTISGRFIIESTNQAASFDPSQLRAVIVDATNAAGTSIVGNATIRAISINDSNVFVQPESFSRRIDPPVRFACNLFVRKGGCPDYKMTFNQEAVTVSLTIGLRGSPSSSLTRTWEDGIEEIWGSERFGSRYSISDGPNQYPLYFDVKFVGGLNPTADLYINVINGQPTETNKFNIQNWFTDISNIYDNSLHGEVAAHEFGHYLGLFDENVGAKALGPFGALCDLGLPQDDLANESCDGIMGTPRLPTVDRYYEHFLEAFSSATGVAVVQGFLPVASNRNTSPGWDEFDDESPSVFEVSTTSTINLVAIALLIVACHFQKFRVISCRSQSSFPLEYLILKVLNSLYKDDNLARDSGIVRMPESRKFSNGRYISC